MRKNLATKAIIEVCDDDFFNNYMITKGAYYKTRDGTHNEEVTAEMKENCKKLMMIFNKEVLKEITKVK